MSIQTYNPVTTDFEHNTVQEARDAAVDDAASSGGRVYPCLVFRQGGRMMIAASTYELFSKAIYHTLMGGKSLTFTQIVEGVHDCFQKQKSSFDRSVEWYAVTVKNDMEARGEIETFKEKGRKLHRLKK